MSTTTHLPGKAASSNASEAVEFFFPFSALRCYEKYDCSGQQIIDAGAVLINGERVSLDLQLAEAGSGRYGRNLILIHVVSDSNAPNLLAGAVNAAETNAHMCRHGDENGGYKLNRETASWQFAFFAGPGMQAPDQPNHEARNFRKCRMQQEQTNCDPTSDSPTLLRRMRRLP